MHIFWHWAWSTQGTREPTSQAGCWIYSAKMPLLSVVRACQSHFPSPSAMVSSLAFWAGCACPTSLSRFRTFTLWSGYLLSIRDPNREPAFTRTSAWFRTSSATRIETKKSFALLSSIHIAMEPCRRSILASALKTNWRDIFATLVLSTRLIKTATLRGRINFGVKLTPAAA